MSTIDPPDPVLLEEYFPKPDPPKPDDTNPRPRKSITDEVETKRLTLVRERVRSRRQD